MKLKHDKLGLAENKDFNLSATITLCYMTDYKITGFTYAKYVHTNSHQQQKK